jgi:triphosphatase
MTATRRLPRNGGPHILYCARAARGGGAAPIALDPAMTVETVLQQIGRACLTHVLHNQAAILAGDPEGVHQMRIALRRLRAMISSFGKMLPTSERRRVVSELKRLDDILGPARNLDVFAIDLLPPARAALPADPALDHLAAALGAARQSACEQIKELILSPRYTETVLRLLRWFEARGWRDGKAPAEADVLSQPIGDVAPRLLDRRLRKVRKRGKGFRYAGAKRQHKLRIALKELRYTIELLGSLFDQQGVQRFGKRLKTLQDSLGYANDVHIGRAVVDALCAQAADRKACTAAGEHVLGWHEHAICAARRKVYKRLRRLKRAAPLWKTVAPA